MVLLTYEKGEKMNIVFALVSIIIVYPILFVLPIRISGKQKLFLIIISLFISIIGILSVHLIPFWQTLLLMVALGGLASILVSKRMPENKVKMSDERDEFLQEKGLFNIEHLNNEQSDLDEINERINLKVEPEKDDVDLVSILDMEPLVAGNMNESIEQMDNSSEETYESLYEELHSDLFAAATLESVDEELDIEHLDGIEENMNIIDTVQPETTKYLSEIEKLLLEEEINSLIEKEEKITPLVESKDVPTHSREIKLEKLY
jgi:hypothetical protein